MTERPALTLDHDTPAAREFVDGLQAAIDATDADLFNRAFARDVLWGSPFGALVEGYDEIHAIHSRMFAAAKTRQGRDAASSPTGRSRYDIEHARLVADDVAVAFVRRFALAEGTSRKEVGPTQPQPGRADTFDELALFVLVRRGGSWWLAAGLHTPDRRDVYA